MKGVRVILKGSERDLSRLEQWFAKLDHRVVKEQGDFILKSPLFEPCGTPQEVREQALQLLDRINAAARLCDPHFDGVSTSKMVVEDEAGVPRPQVWVEVPSVQIIVEVGSVTVAATDSTPAPPPPSFVEVALALGQNDPEVARALQYFLLDQQTWASLYSIWEIVRHDLDLDPAKQGVLGAVGIDQAEAESFIETANSSTHTGLLGRHGRPDKKAMKHPPMTLDEAEELVRRMLQSWIDLKARSNPPHPLATL